jgi:hypothetical protein
VWALVQTIVHGVSGDKHKEIPTPNSFNDATEGEYSMEWLESMASELHGLKNTDTYVEVPRPSNRNVVKSKWVYRVKRRPEGTPQFKSRLVAKGFSQKPGVDFVDTWAPTARQATARLILHLAAALDFHVHAMDVDQAFLQGDLEEEIYMEPPPGFPPATPGHVWRLQRPLYGLRQSPRQWHAKLKAVLLQLGFQPSAGDPSLFIGQARGVWMLVYVDDLLLMSQSLSALNDLKDALKATFPMKDLGEVTTYLGMEITRNWDSKEIFLSQRKHIASLVSRFGGSDLKTYATPLAVNHGLTLPLADETLHPDQDRFPELLGGIMYLMVCTRPDIAHAVSVLSRFIAPGRHGHTHWRAALRLLGYLKATEQIQLALGGVTLCVEG